MTETAGIIDVSVRTQVDPAPKAATSSPEAGKELPAKQRVLEAQKQGVGLIKSKQENGFFDTGDGVNIKEDAEIVLTQEKQEHGKLDSAGLKAFFSATSSIGAEAVEIETAAAKNMRIKVEGRDLPLTLDEWRRELDGLNNNLRVLENPTDGSPIDQQKAEDLKQKIKALETGDFAYEFPKEEKEEAGGGKPEAGILIEQKLNDLEKKKDKSEDDKKLLVMLRLAKRANGPLDAIVKYPAIRQLYLLSPTPEGKKVMDYMRGEVVKAMDGGDDLRGSNQILRENGWSDKEIEQFSNGIIGSGSITGLIESGAFQKATGLDKAMFGKNAKGEEITEEEIRSLLDPEHKRDWSKLGNIFGILFALMFAADISKQVLSEENR